MSAAPPTGVRLTTAHTAQLDDAVRQELRDLLDTAFGGVFDQHDHEHCLGGVHVLLRDAADGALVGHGAVVQRRLLHGGRAWRAGYVEGVAVRPDRRRRGYAGAVMAEIEDVVRRAYDLGALSASDDGVGLYASRGWTLWTGPTSVLAPDGLRRTPDDDDSVFVLPVTAELDVAGGIGCDWREGDVW